MLAKIPPALLAKSRRALGEAIGWKGAIGPSGKPRHACNRSCLMMQLRETLGSTVATACDVYPTMMPRIY